MFALYLLSVRQLSSKWRLIIIVILAVAPVIAALIQASGSFEEGSAYAFVDNTLLRVFIAPAILPFIVLGVAAGAFGNELEDRTLSNLTLSPLSRWRIVIPKLAAVLSISAPLVVVSASVSTALGLVYVEAALAVAAGTLLGVAVYGAIFTWLGLITSRAIVYGLLYVVFWEGFIANFADGIKYLSVQQYTLSAIHAVDSKLLADPDLGLIDSQTALIGGVVVFALFTALSVYRLRTMDVP